MSFTETPVSGTKQIVLSRTVVDLSRLYENYIKLTYVVSDMYKLNTATVIEPQADVIVESVDPFDEVPAIDPITDQPIPGKTYTQNDLYDVLYSYYKSVKL